MKKYNYPNSKVSSYDILPSKVRIYCKDGSKYVFDAETVGTGRLAMIKAFALSGANLDALINGQYTFIV